MATTGWEERLPMRMLRMTLAVAMLTLVAIPAIGEAQETRRTARIGVISPAAGRNPIDEAFEQYLRDLGWVKDQNVRIDLRHSAGRQDAADRHAAELVRLGVDVLVAWGPSPALAAMRATGEIPIVVVAVVDPVGVGLVSNLARPDKNATGVAFQVTRDTHAP